MVNFSNILIQGNPLSTIKLSVSSYMLTGFIQDINFNENEKILNGIYTYNFSLALKNCSFGQYFSNALNQYDKILC